VAGLSHPATAEPEQTMQRNIPLLLVAAALAAPLVGLSAGCQQFSTTSHVSPDEEKNFKGGGPIPPEAQKEIAKRMKAAQEKAKQAGQTPPPAAVPGAPGG
jgi:hypothetical protein